MTTRIDGGTLDGGRPTLHYPHILRAFNRAILAILPEKLEEIRAFLEVKMRGGNVSAEHLQEVLAARREGGVQVFGRVAVMPVFGTIAHRVGAMAEASGGVSAERLGATLDGLVADKTVK